jgi:predicted MFS family arabinose efflux permease
LREIFGGRRGRIAAGLLVAEFVAATQGLVIAAIVPRVTADLHGLAAYPLAFGSFFAALLVFLPFAGPWMDRYGARRMLAIGLAVMAAGLAAMALSPTMAFFIAGRFVEGAGDGIDYAVTFAVVAKTFRGPLRARMISLSSAMWIVPALVAPALGAYVTAAFGWRWAFAGFLPLIAIAAALMLPVIGARARPQGGDAFAALRLLFSYGTLVARAGMHAVFVAYALVYAAFFGIDAYVALMLTSVRGLSLQAASLCITLGAVGWSFASLAVPPLLSRARSTWIATAAAAAFVLGASGLIVVALGAPIPFAFAASTLAGAGIGLAYPTLSVLVLGFAQTGDEGTISSAALLAGVVGIVAGALLCGIPIAVAGHGYVALRDAMAAAFGIVALFALALALVSGRLPPSRTNG